MYGREIPENLGTPFSMSLPWIYGVSKRKQ